MPFDLNSLQRLAGFPNPASPGPPDPSQGGGPGHGTPSQLQPLASQPAPTPAPPESGDPTSDYGDYHPSQYPDRPAPLVDGGQGYSNFGHPTEVPDVYREAVGAPSPLLPNPAPLPRPGNPPLRFPYPDSVSPGLYPAPKRLWQWFELTLVSGAGTTQTITLYDVPEYWIVTTDATPTSRTKVIQAANDGSGVVALRLGLGGELRIPAVDRYLTIVNLTATTQQVWVLALRGYDVECKYHYGS